MKKLLVIFAIFGITLIGCKEDDDKTTGPSGESFTFPLAVGNYWNFNEYEYNAAADEEGDFIRTYKIEIVGKTTFKGKESYQLIQEAEVESDTSYIRMENEVIYVGGETYGTQAELAPDWVKFYDPNANSWESMNIDFSEGGMEMKVNGKVTNEGSTNVTIDGESRTAIKLNHVINMESTFSFGGQTQTQTQSITQRYLLVNGIGFYQIISTYDNDLLDDTIEILTDYNVSN